MRSQLELAADALFPETGNMVGNVKFFTVGRTVNSQALAEQMNRADAQIAAGESEPCDDIDGDLTI